MYSNFDFLEMDEDGKSALDKCRNLTPADKTEVGLLRSRVDEQSNLIMILKARADEEYGRRKVFEDIVDSIQLNATESEETMKAEKEKLRVLEQNFDILGRL